MGTVPGGPEYTSISALQSSFRAIILYRILRGLPDVADEFDSYAKMGQRSRFPLTGATLARWGATSMYDLLAEARNVAWGMRIAGRHVAEIAEVHLPDVGWFVVQQTGQNRHHWSVWGDTEHIAEFIMARHLI